MMEALYLRVMLLWYCSGAPEHSPGAFLFFSDVANNSDVQSMRQTTRAHAHTAYLYMCLCNGTFAPMLSWCHN